MGRGTGLALVVGSLVAAATNAYPAAGEVLSHQLVGEGYGGFPHALAAEDVLGHGLAVIGDLDDDGVVDLAASFFDDSVGFNRGGVYILFMNANGTVDSTARIGSSLGGFGPLDDADVFGHSIAPLGDLDSDGIEDIAVSAAADDDGGTDRGAVYILFMNTNGSVKSYQKISQTAGGFAGTLTDGWVFGGSLANIGDLDNDGVVDLAVGQYQGSAPGNSNVWILFLNADGSVDTHALITGKGAQVAGLGDLDGDSVEDILVGGDMNVGGPNRGSVEILLLNANGTIKSTHVIGSLTTGFAGALDDGDEFGIRLAKLGDVDGDSIVDFAVGAIRDDDGGSNRGALYVIFPNSDGTVKGYQKISQTSGGLTYGITDEDTLGGALAGVGDMNGDLKLDLVSSVRDSASGDVSQGALVVMFLDGATVPVELDQFQVE